MTERHFKCIFLKKRSPSSISSVYLASDPHGCGAVVLLFEELADPSEVSQLEPTGFQAAGAGDSVTLTGHISKFVDRLKERQRHAELQSQTFSLEFSLRNEIIKKKSQNIKES